jgi:hypothetical protein
VNCPYCAEPVNHSATVCKTCQRDIALVASLQDAKQALEERVEELEAELAQLRGAAPGESQQPIIEEPPKPPGLLDLIVVYLLLPTVVLIGAHYLLVIKFDARLAWLRAASIGLPALFGLMLELRLHPRWFVMLGFGAVVALAAVFGMSTMVHVTDGGPILPRSAVDWRETLEYSVSIALSYLLGSLLATAAQPLKLRSKNKNPAMAKLAIFMAKHVSGRKGEPMEARIQRMVKLIQLGVSASTAIGALYTGFKNVL